MFWQEWIECGGICWNVKVFLKSKVVNGTHCPVLFFILLPVVVVLAFIICWLPYHIGRNLFAQVGDYNTATLSQKFNMASMVLCYVSASINPVVYNLMSRKYRAAAKRLFLHHRPKQAHRGQRQSVIDHIPTLNESLTGVWGATVLLAAVFSQAGLTCLTWKVFVEVEGGCLFQDVTIQGLWSFSLACCPQDEDFQPC